MKKNYIAPSIDVYKQRAISLLTSSVGGLNTTGQAGTGSSGAGNGVNFGHETDADW